MTALVVTAAFIAKLSQEYPSLRKDFETFKRHVDYCLAHGNAGSQLLTTYVGDLLRFSKAIVKAVNKGKLEFSSPSLARKSHAAYPRFLSGLTSMIFTENGYLRFAYNKVALKHVLEILALLKRVKHPNTVAEADRQGFKEFEEYQRKTRHVDDTVVPPLAALWDYITRGISAHATLGYPGPGATLDEYHPYAPRFSFVDPRTLPKPCADFYAQAFRNVTGEDIYKFTLPGFHVPWLTMSRDFLAQNFLPVYYPFVYAPQLNTVCVPKNVTVSRAITIAPVGNTIIGATYRNSIKNMWRVHGVEHLMNVHDQSLSHDVLRRFFNDLTLMDLEGGSSTLILDLLENIVPDFLKPFFHALRGSTFETPNGVFEVTTLLMGDSIATAILTTTMFLVDVLAVYNRKLCTTPRLLHEKILEGLTSRGESKFIEALSGVSSFGLSIESARIPSYEEFLDILAEMREMPIRNVGDDKVIPHYLEPYVRDILSRIGTTVNEDKSSTKGSYHKETCGCWVISDGKETMEIFPFRAPEGDTRPLKLQAATEFLQRISRSTSISHFTAALAYAYGPELTASSYRSDQIGSPEGVGLPCVITQQSNILLARVDDDLAYVFNLKSDDWSDSVSRELPNDGTCSSFEHFIPYRISKRSSPSRVRFRGFRDPSKPKGLRVPKNYEVVFNSNLMGDDSETASLREHRRWSARWLESFVSASCEAILDIW